MQNITENTLPVWFFFSDVDATALNESARKLLVWSGDNFGPLFSATDNILDAMMVPRHRLSKESIIELIALLGASFGSNPYPSPSARELFTNCVMILSRKLAELPKEEI